MAAGEPEGSAAESEQEQEAVAEETRSFKDLVRLGRSRFWPRCSLPGPEEQRPAPRARMRQGELPGQTRAALRGQRWRSRAGAVGVRSLPRSGWH